eukprot:scaffold614_cov367-Prasinococcus_capsulatus_cf.AAC.38
MAWRRGSAVTPDADHLQGPPRPLPHAMEDSGSAAAAAAAAAAAVQQQQLKRAISNTEGEGPPCAGAPAPRCATRPPGVLLRPSVEDCSLACLLAPGQANRQLLEEAMAWVRAPAAAASVAAAAASAVATAAAAVLVASAGAATASGRRPTRFASAVPQAARGGWLLLLLLRRRRPSIVLRTTRTVVDAWLGCVARRAGSRGCGCASCARARASGTSSARAAARSPRCGARRAPTSTCVGDRARRCACRRWLTRQRAPCACRLGTRWRGARSAW